MHNTSIITTSLSQPTLFDHYIQLSYDQDILFCIFCQSLINSTLITPLRFEIILIVGMPHNNQFRDIFFVGIYPRSLLLFSAM